MLVGLKEAVALILNTPLIKNHVGVLVLVEVTCNISRYIGKEPYESVIYEIKKLHVFASIFMTLCVCFYDIINSVL